MTHTYYVGNFGLGIVRDLLLQYGSTNNTSGFRVVCKAFTIEEANDILENLCANNKSPSTKFKYNLEVVTEEEKKLCETYPIIINLDGMTNLGSRYFDLEKIMIENQELMGSIPMLTTYESLTEKRYKPVLLKLAQDSLKVKLDFECKSYVVALERYKNITLEICFFNNPKGGARQLYGYFNGLVHDYFQGRIVHTQGTSIESINTYLKEWEDFVPERFLEKMRSTLNKLEKNPDRALHFMTRHGMELINEIVKAITFGKLNEEFTIDEVKEFVKQETWEIPDAYLKTCIANAASDHQSNYYVKSFEKVVEDKYRLIKSVNTLL